ncbi:MAG: helicase-related protein [Thermodesulfobacteriota bacterium]|nr:helicase-related protein [Thermodesulfobacteriota bacterium]
MVENRQSQLVFQNRQWRYAYKTSAIGLDGRPVNILHDFYIPVLKRSVAYDRVAGYFRSSSLAAASQGFSAFSVAGGQMRLIVGADLAPHDVAAILDGDEQRFADRLNEELAGPSSWPEDVANGVALLAWMVAQRCLTVRVAFRVNGQTGGPLSFDAVEDGYVHEKWGVFTDTADDRIYMSGSLNESRQALIHNAENISLHADWWGESDRQRIDDAARSFEALWENQNPYIVVMSLPEAVDKRLIEIGQSISHPREIDGSSAKQPDFPPPSAMERLKFAIIKDGPRLPGGRYVGLETAPVKPWPHQAVVARRLVETWPYSYLLCDEVGLGKTIEAGLAIRSLYLSGLVRRVLIAPPASLSEQWHREMAAKCLLGFARARGSGQQARHDYIFPEERHSMGKTLYDPDLVIVSTGLLSRQQRQADLDGAESFDLSLVDEAHYARRKNPGNGARSAPQYGRLFETIARRLNKKSRALWLATATPMQLDWIEVFDLIFLTNRIAHFQHDPSLTWAYYEALGQLVRNQDMADHQWELLRRAIFSLQRFDPFLWRFFETAVMDGTIRIAANRWGEQGDSPTGIDRRNIQRLVFAAAPLSRVMMRHTRALLEIYKEKDQLGENLAEREILQVPTIRLTGLEKSADDALDAYCRELVQKIAENNQGNQWRTSLGFYLSFLRLRLASSLFALRETLKRRKQRVAATLAQANPEQTDFNDLDSHDQLFGDSEDAGDPIVDTVLKHRTETDLAWEQARLEAMLAMLTDLSDMPLKMKEVLTALEKQRQGSFRISQTVIFTRFYDTLTDIRDRLRKVDANMRVGTYSGRGGQFVDPATGRLRNVNRDDIRHRFFRGEIDVLVCTDAAAEGLNLQTANLVVNYDLPWNPMKVEQRIGRIDRIGQAHERIYVLNLCYVDSAEQIVYDRLLRRLAQAGDVVGTQQIALLPVTGKEFEELATRELDPEVLLERARERVQEQKQRTQSMEIPPRQLYDIYVRLKDSRKDTPPVTLPDIYDLLAGSAYLAALGGAVSEDGRYYYFPGLADGPGSAALTVDRVLFEKGLAEGAGPLHFAAYGDSVFDSLMAAMDRFDLPPCAVRLVVPVPDILAHVVAYAVACVNEAGDTEVRLVRSYSQLAGATLDEGRHLTAEDAKVAENELKSLMRQEFDPTRRVDHFIRDNQKAGKSQKLLNLLVADSLFPPTGRAEYENFYQVVNQIDQEVIGQRAQLMVPKLPREKLANIKDDLIVDIQVPQAGDTASPTLPVFIIASAVNEACRLADSLHEKRADITIAKVKQRINRELQQMDIL